MRENLSKEMRDCYAHAKACARKVEDPLPRKGARISCAQSKAGWRAPRSYELPQALLQKT